MSAAASRNPFTRLSAASPNPTGRSSISTQSASPSLGGPGFTDTPADLIDDELPAYSATADVYRGEAVVEVGPRRPFQPAPPPQLVPQPSAWSPPPFPPPPIHPSLARSVSSPQRPREHLSDFARDFYASEEASSQYNPPPEAPPASVPRSRQAGDESDASQRPTSTPTPGRPLLHNNHILVYEAGHICHKCEQNSRSFLESSPILNQIRFKYWLQEL